MISFLLGAALLVAATLALLLRPWWQRQREARTRASRRALNTAIYRDQLMELERDRETGSLQEDDYQQARQELQRRLIEDSALADAPAAPASAKAPAIAMAMALPTLAAGLYLLLGNPAGLNPPAPQHRFSASDIEQMVANLAARLEQDPENLQGWVMLARSYKAMERFDEAEKAYGRAIKLVEADAQLLADYAEVTAMAAGGNLEGRPRQLIEQALRIDPASPPALLLAGTAAFERSDYARAIDYWQQIKNQLPPDSEDAQIIESGIERARAAAKRK